MGLIGEKVKECRQMKKPILFLLAPGFEDNGRRGVLPGVRGDVGRAVILSIYKRSGRYTL